MNNFILQGGAIDILALFEFGLTHKKGSIIFGVGE